MSVFFLGSWEMNRSAEQTNLVNREAVLVGFVCSALRFISHEPRKPSIADHTLFSDIEPSSVILSQTKCQIVFGTMIQYLTFISCPIEELFLLN